MFESIKRNNQNISADTFEYVPLIDVNDANIPWDEIKDDYHKLDQYLYKRFNLSSEDILFIENNILD